MRKTVVKRLKKEAKKSGFSGLARKAKKDYNRLRRYKASAVTKRKLSKREKRRISNGAEL